MDEGNKAEESLNDGDRVLKHNEVNSGDHIDKANLMPISDDQTAVNEDREHLNLTDSADGLEKHGKEMNGIKGGENEANTQNDDVGHNEEIEVSRLTAEINKIPAEVKENSGESIGHDINSDNANSNEGSNDASFSSNSKSISPRKAKKRGIFVSYAPEASFLEKRFISYTIKELKNIGFCDDIWFDKDDGVPIESPFCFQQRLEIAEKCRASIMFLSESYFGSKVCRHEGQILLNRNEDRESADEKDEIEKPAKLFCIKYSRGKLPQEYKQIEERALDLSSYGASSVAELSSVVVGTISEDLEKYAPLFGLRIPTPPSDPDILKIDRQKPVSSWNISDVLAWLASLKMQAHCSLSFEENEVDGYVLVSMRETDIENHLNVDSRVARRKLIQQVKKIQEDQAQTKENWYLKCLKSKVKEDSVYVICDPNDVQFYYNLRADLVQKNLQVFKHERLGQSRDEFLQLNATHLASSSHVIIILSNAAATSLFIYNEVLFADWLGKPFVVAMAANSWNKLRPNMQAILGSCPAVDFESRPYEESMDILLYHLKPFRNMPAVILEQEFLDRMADGLKPLRVLAVLPEKKSVEEEQISPRPNLFLSYHWDVQNKVQMLVQYLESHGFQCWTDVSNANKRHTTRHSSNHGDTLQTQIQRNIKAAAAVVCCVTPKYICSENCTKDLSVAESLNKPVIPVMLQWLAWPPEGGRVRRILAPLSCIDMSNDSLFKRNLSTVETHLKKLAGKHSPRDSHVIEHVRLAKNQRQVHKKYPQKVQ